MMDTMTSIRTVLDITEDTVEDITKVITTPITRTFVITVQATSLWWTKESAASARICPAVTERAGGFVIDFVLLAYSATPQTVRRRSR